MMLNEFGRGMNFANEKRKEREQQNEGGAGLKAIIGKLEHLIPPIGKGLPLNSFPIPHFLAKVGRSVG